MRLLWTSKGGEPRAAEVLCAALPRRGDDESFKRPRFESEDEDRASRDGNMLVCVTSGVSFLGRAIVERLLLHGYSVRILVDNEEDVEKAREMELSGESGVYGNRVKAVMAKVTQVQSLIEAFDGCSGVFHTSAFVDPAGVSGYSRSMAELEAKATENVMEACARTESIRKCVFTSSLLACIWQNTTQCDRIINHRTWSDESVCINKKLWYALGKLKAEKAAWRIAKDRGIRLATICPGLITGRDFFQRSPSSTIAYLKGAQEMYANGLLATVDVKRLAKQHLCIYEELGKTAFGRFVSFDHVIERNGAEKLAREICIQTEKISGWLPPSEFRPRFELSDKKLLSIMSRTIGTCRHES